MWFNENERRSAYAKRGSRGSDFVAMGLEEAERALACDTFQAGS